MRSHHQRGELPERVMEFHDFGDRRPLRNEDRDFLRIMNFRLDQKPGEGQLDLRFTASSAEGAGPRASSADRLVAGGESGISGFREYAGFLNEPFAVQDLDRPAADPDEALVAQGLELLVDAFPRRTDHGSQIFLCGLHADPDLPPPSRPSSFFFSFLGPWVQFGSCGSFIMAMVKRDET